MLVSSVFSFLCVHEECLPSNSKGKRKYEKTKKEPALRGREIV